jgi:hypothetical protein
VEQRDWWQPGRRAPGYAGQCRQLSEARAAFPWLAEGSVIVQQQALRDFQAAQVSWVCSAAPSAQAVRQDPAGAATNPPGQPGFRKRGQCEGFRIVATGPQDVRPLNRRWA